MQSVHGEVYCYNDKMCNLLFALYQSFSRAAPDEVTEMVDSAGDLEEDELSSVGNPLFEDPEKNESGSAGDSEEDGSVSAGDSEEDGSVSAGDSDEDGSVSAGDSEEDGSVSAGDSEEDGSGSAGDSEDEPDDPRVQEEVSVVEMVAFPIAPRCVTS